MISDHQGCFLIGMPASAQIAHRPARAEQSFPRGGAERDQLLWLDDLDLFDEIRPACLHFERRRRPVPERALRRVGTALENVGDVNVATRAAHGLNYFRAQWRS